jgi:hypothetical protein
MTIFQLNKVPFLVLLIATLSSCSTFVNQSIRETNARVEFTKSDFTLSDQVTGEASVLRIFGIDFSRSFNKETGDIFVYGNKVNSRAQRYAIYNLLSKNKGYDVIFYPQYEVVQKGSFLFGKTTVKVTAKLGKLNK